MIALAGGVALVLAFIAHELRTRHPMLPMGFFADRAFAVTNGDATQSVVLPSG